MLPARFDRMVVGIQDDAPARRSRRRLRHFSQHVILVEDGLLAMMDVRA